TMTSHAGDTFHADHRQCWSQKKRRRQIMELERGFRRIALTTSAVIFVAALAFDGYAIDRIVDYRDRLDRWGREFKNCMDNTKVFRESGLAKRLSETQVSRT